MYWSQINKGVCRKQYYNNKLVPVELLGHKHKAVRKQKLKVKTQSHIMMLQLQPISCILLLGRNVARRCYY